MKGLHVNVYGKDVSPFMSSDFTIFINISNVVYLKDDYPHVLLVMTNGSFHIGKEDATRIKQSLVN